jgi:hypothetical protein
MFNVTNNINSVLAPFLERLVAFNADEICQQQAVYVVGAWRRRIHIDGNAADGSQIGTYSSGYMKVRTGAFKSPNIARGANKGKPRPLYNRKSDTKVILSLTSQMEQDLTVLPTSRGWGVGYNNSTNRDKAAWNEERYRKAIFMLTDEEAERAGQIAIDGFNK